MTSRETQNQLLARARAGDASALGRLVDLYRNYLWVIARAQLRDKPGLGISASDLVQETFVDACRGFSRFRGSTEGELMAWLRHVLAHNLVDELKRQGRDKRDWRRRQSLDALIEHSSEAAHAALARGVASPSQVAQDREEAVMLADAIVALPADYREVILLRHVQGLAFADIARAMRRSPGAARMLWTRAIDQLRGGLEARDTSPPENRADT